MHKPAVANADQAEVLSQYTWHVCRILAMEEKPPMQKQSFAYILGWSQEKIAGLYYL